MRDIQGFWTACTSDFSSQMFSEFLLLNVKEIPVILKKILFNLYQQKLVSVSFKPDNPNIPT